MEDAVSSAARRVTTGEAGEPEESVPSRFPPVPGLLVNAVRPFARASGFTPVPGTATSPGRRAATFPSRGPPSRSRRMLSATKSSWPDSGSCGLPAIGSPSRGSSARCSRPSTCTTRPGGSEDRRGFRAAAAADGCHGQDGGHVAAHLRAGLVRQRVRAACRGTGPGPVAQLHAQQPGARVDAATRRAEAVAGVRARRWHGAAGNRPHAVPCPAAPQGPRPERHAPGPSAARRPAAQPS